MCLCHHRSPVARDSSRAFASLSTFNFGLLTSFSSTFQPFNRVSFLSPSSPHLCALCVLCGENSSSFRSSLIPRHSPLTTNSFTIRTSKTPLPQLLYNPHLQAPFGSAGNKGLITPLESALTKNSPVTPVESALTKRWGVGVILATPEFATRHSSLPTMFKSFLFRLFHTLLRFFAPVKNSTLLFSSNSELFAENTRVWGRGVDLPNHKRVLFRSLPESASFDSRPRPNIQSRRFVGRKPVELYQREQSMKKGFWVCAAGIFVLLGQAARLAAQAPEREAKAPEAKAAEKCDPATAKEESSVTEHTIKIGGQTIPYKATASTILLKNEKGDSTGLIYPAAY